MRRAPCSPGRKLKISRKRFRVPHGATILPLLSTSICDNFLSKNNQKNSGHDKGCRPNSARLVLRPEKISIFRFSKLLHKRRPKADSYADQILFGSISTFFLRSCSFLTDIPRKSAIKLSEKISSLSERYPAQNLPFSRGAVQVFCPRLTIRQKKLSCPSFEHRRPLAFGARTPDVFGQILPYHSLQYFEIRRWTSGF